MKLSVLRRFHWGIILLCFFLPAVEGCNKEIIYPYQDFFNPEEWLQTTIYFYPVAFFLIGGFIFKITKFAFRFAAAWTIAYMFFLALSYLISRSVYEMPETYCILLILLWGIMAFGLLRVRDDNGLIDLIGFFLTAFSLWLFPFVFLFREKILLGGWLYIYAGGIILTTYLWEFWQRRNEKIDLTKREDPCGLKI